MSNPIQLPLRSIRMIAILLSTPMLFTCIYVINSIVHFEDQFDPNTLKGLVFIVSCFITCMFCIATSIQLLRVAFIVNPRIKFFTIYGERVSFPFGFWKRQLIEVELNQIKDVITWWRHRNRTGKMFTIVTASKEYPLAVGMFKCDSDAVLFLKAVSKGKIHDLSPWNEGEDRF
jgi:hypothetical protein